MTGRGLLSAALIAAAFINSIPGMVLLIAGTSVLQGWTMWRRQSYKEDQMVNDYRDEIAARLGIDPTRVTGKHLHTVAYGDPSTGLEGNYVMAQSLERSGTRKLVGLLSTVASAFLVMGGMLLLGSVFKAGLPAALDSIHAALSSVLPVYGDSKIFYMLLASGTGMGIMNNVIDYGVEWALGLNRRTAQSLIREIRRDIDMNKTVSQEQVFAVFVAANPGLDRIIETAYGSPYYELKPEQQTDALQQYGRSFQNPAVTKRTIESLTHDINTRQIEADELVFAVVNQESGIPKLNNPQPVGAEKTKTRQLQEELGMALHGQHKSSAEQSRDIQRELQVSEASANDNQPGFSARFSPRNMSGESHADQVTAKREVPSLSHVQKELERSAALLDGGADLKR